MINSVKMGLQLWSTKLLCFTASSDFTSVLPYVSLTSTIHLNLPVDEKILIVKCEHWESFNEDLDDCGKFRKQLEVGLLCWEHEGCSSTRQCLSFYGLTMFPPFIAALSRKILCCGILE